VERLIGTIRRDLLDQTLFWNSVDLESKLLAFRDDYNGERVHSSLDGLTPEETGGRPCRKPLELENFRWQPHCRRLYQLPAVA
jgi:putative transposase